MDSDLSLEFLRVVEQAAIACAHTMGQGDRHRIRSGRRRSDAPHRWTRVPIDGTIVIGEGERDEAPMLFIGEKVGMAHALEGRAAAAFRRSTSPSIRSRARTCARPARRTRSRCSRRRHRADCCTRPTSTWRSSSSVRARRTHVSLDAPVHENLKAIARCLGRTVEDLVVIVLDRPRHEKLIADIRATGARIRLIGDGDLSAGIAAAVVGSGVHAVMGTGGAPEGVLTAAAMRCLNGEIFARLVVTKPEHEERCRAMGITDFKKIYASKDLAPGATRDLRGDRRHRRHADARRALLRRRHPDELGDHAERSAPDPVHRQHSRRAGERRQDTVLIPVLTHWRRNLFAVTAASFIGFTGFTLVMPFLPLFIRQLGVTDVGEIALWTGAILGVTPALTALMSPFWGRLADRFGRRIMVARSLVACAVVDGADGVRHEALAGVRAARGARALRRLRRAHADDGGRVGAARANGRGDRHACRRRSGWGRRSDR